MKTELDFKITPQPDDTTCGPSCLHALYRFYGDEIPEEQVYQEVPQLEAGGTLAGILGLHAQRRGYHVTIYTCNLQLFDPTWFQPGAPPLRDKLLAQLRAKSDAKLHAATQPYLELLENGAEVYMEDITPELIAETLEEGTPIITGLSATWLYRNPRERPADTWQDDVGGYPVGHFVVLNGYDQSTGRVMVADPNCNEPFPASHTYEVDADRLIAAIYLGIVTYDAKLLIIRPRD